MIQIFILIVLIAVFETFDLDIKIQNFFFNSATQKWLLNKNDKILTFIFYDGIKVLIILFGLINLSAFIVSYFNEKFSGYRKNCLYIVLCLAIIPSVVGLIKNYSNVYCPYELEIYNGNKPHIKTFSRMPEFLKKNYTERGKGFPAGPASGGFALMCLFYVLKKEKYKIYGLVTGLSLGWIMGMYQVLRGAHFISHNFITCLISIISIHIIFLSVNSKRG